jgi:seryl-tRNA synthetase
MRALFAFFWTKGANVMLDIQWIRNHPEELRRAAEAKGIPFPVNDLLALDERRRSLLKETEGLRAERNAAAERIAGLRRRNETQGLEREKEEARAIHARLAAAEAERVKVEAEFRRLMLEAPNPFSPDTPIGGPDTDNVEIARSGKPPAFPFPPRDHIELGESLGLFDLARGAKAGGSRSYFLTGAGLYLHRAVQQLALDLLADRGYLPMDVPVMVREDALEHSGFFPGGREQTYELEKEGKWLAGTSEAPLISFYSGEVVDVAEPIRLAAASACGKRDRRGATSEGCTAFTSSPR